MDARPAISPPGKQGRRSPTNENFARLIPDHKQCKSHINASLQLTWTLIYNLQVPSTYNQPKLEENMENCSQAQSPDARLNTSAKHMADERPQSPDGLDSGTYIPSNFLVVFFFLLYK